MGRMCGSITISSAGAAGGLATRYARAAARVRSCKADVTDDADVQRMLAEVTRGGDLDILVNNAGPKIHSAPFDKLTGAIWMQPSRTSSAASSASHRRRLPALKKSRGKVINILTSAALGRTSHNWLPYVTAKAALLAMSKNLAQELGPAGVR